MSVVVAIKKGDKVYIGADSQVTRGGTRTTLKNPNNYKIWQVKGVDHCLMAHVGMVRDANIVRLMGGIISDYDIYRDIVDYGFVVRRLVPAIISELRGAGFMKDEQYFTFMESKYLFAFKDKLYLNNSDGCVIEIDDYVAMGSGEDQAIGSLLSTEKEDPEIRIVKAIKASAATDIYVDYPIILTDTESTEFKVITETDEKKFLKGEKK